MKIKQFILIFSQDFIELPRLYLGYLIQDQLIFGMKIKKNEKEKKRENKGEKEKKKQQKNEKRTQNKKNKKKTMRKGKRKN